MFTTSPDCSKVILGFYLGCLSCVMHSVMLVQWWVTRWYISQNVSPSVRHYMTGYFHQKANATGLWIIYRITDYTVPSGEGTECCPVSGPQGTLLFRSLSFLSVKGGGSDTNWGENVRGAQGCQKSTTDSMNWLLKGGNLTSDCDRGHSLSEGTGKCL